MKRLMFCSLLAVSSMLMAQEAGEVCQTAYPVGNKFETTLQAETYWFTSNTNNLPITVYYFPEDTLAPKPEVWLDFTCEPGVYADTWISEMVKVADKYSLQFPMQETLEKVYVDGVMAYKVSFNESYRDMLYGQGVTYAIPAYVKIISYCTANLNINSESMHELCVGESIELYQNSSLPLVTADSANSYLLPIGEWINDTYDIIWEGEPAEVYIGSDCGVASYRRIWKHISFAHDTVIVMDRSKATEWISNAYAPELYWRIYTNDKGGKLSIKPHVDNPYIQSFVIAGVPAVVDNDALTITAVLPKGSNRTNELKAAVCEPEVSPVTGEKFALKVRNTQLQFGELIYSLAGVKVATDDMSYDASLKQVLIDGVAWDGFVASQLSYAEVEVKSANVKLEALCNDSKSTAVVSSFSSLPATVTITVTAEAGNMQVYTLNLVAERSRNALLQSITIDGALMPSFDKNVYSYRLEVVALPQVAAVAADKKASVEVRQASGVPGIAQIVVTAEYGNVETYTINFAQDAQQIGCGKQAQLVADGTSVQLLKDEEKVMRIEKAGWNTKRMLIEWSGNADLQLAVGTMCMFAEGDKNFMQNINITIPKGETAHKVYLTQDDVAAMFAQTTSDVLYLRATATEAGELSFSSAWAETCLTTGILLDLPSELLLPQNHLASTVYKIYVADWKGKDVEIGWQSMVGVTMWLANNCKFNLVATNRSVIDFISFGVDETKSFSASQLAELFGDNDFVYVKFNKERPAGTISIREKNGGGATGINEVGSAAKVRKMLIDGRLLIELPDGTIYDAMGVRQ